MRQPNAFLAFLPPAVHPLDFPPHPRGGSGYRSKINGNREEGDTAEKIA